MQKITVQKCRDHPYLIMDKTGLQDDRLSWKAKGLLAYLLSLPDDRNVYMEDLQNRSRDGRDATAQGMKELINFGYIHRERVNAEEGKFHYEYTVYESPRGTISENDSTKPNSPGTPFPGTVNPGTVNPGLENNKHSEKYKHIEFNNIIYSNIILSIEEYNILYNKYNIESLEKNIIALSQYLKTTRKKYKSHYLTLNKRMMKQKNEGKLAIPISDEGEKIFEVIKKYADRVDGTVADCERLKMVILETYPHVNPVAFVDEMVNKMIKTGQSAFYSIASPGGMIKNLGTIITKIKTVTGEQNKPTTIKVENGQFILS